MLADPYVTQDDLVRDRLHAATAAVHARTAAERDPAAPTPVDELEAAIDARLAATRAIGRDWPVDWLRSRLELTATEQRVVWLLLAHELDPRTRAELRALATEAVSDVTVDVLRRVVYGDGPSLRAWRELSPGAPLFRLGLVERTDGGGDIPDQRQTLRVARRLLALAHGELKLDHELAAIAVPSLAPRALGDVVIADSVVAQLRAAIASRGVVVAAGSPGVGRRTALVAVAAEAGHAVLDVDARELASDPIAAARQLRLVGRECRLLRHVPLIRHLDALVGDGDGPGRLALVDRELVAQLDLPVLLTAGPCVPALRWSRPAVTVPIPAPSAVERANLWASALPGLVAREAAALASTFPLAPAVIHAAGRAALAHAEPLTRETIQRGIRSVLDDRMAGLASRVTVSQTWDDLVLPGEELEAVVELLARVRERGRVHDEWGFARKLGRGLGTSALFSGPPGTGKTMVAGLIAKELGLPLYRADLAKITSKWIGETEKHLAALFDAAEAGHVVLLFDEADALFAKRTEVRSSNDRYANLEVNYLLQRLESFTGICILTTNHDTAMDDAFRRRLSLHVRFTMPAAAERATLWGAMIPGDAPVAPDLDVDALAARFAMTGGHIRNAVLRAAFLAADEGTSICNAHLVRGGRLEYEAIGKIA